MYLLHRATDGTIADIDAVKKVPIAKFPADALWMVDRGDGFGRRKVEAGEASDEEILNEPQRRGLA